jgi:hypothetical protein
VICHPTLNGSFALPGNAARRHYYLTSAKNLIDFRCGLRNVLKHPDYRGLGAIG